MISHVDSQLFIMNVFTWLGILFKEWVYHFVVDYLLHDVHYNYLIHLLLNSCLIEVECILFIFLYDCNAYVVHRRGVPRVFHEFNMLVIYIYGGMVTRRAYKACVVVVECRKFVCDVHENDQLISLNRFKDNIINTACSKK